MPSRTMSPQLEAKSLASARMTEGVRDSYTEVSAPSGELRPMQLWPPGDRADDSHAAILKDTIVGAS